MPYISELAPIFVVGYMHAGTTLLQNILRLNKSLYVCRGETRFFEFLPQTRVRFPNLVDNNLLEEYVKFIVSRIDDKHELDADEIQELLQAAKCHRDYVEVFGLAFDFLASKNGKSRWAEKTPTHIFFVDEIIELIPNARFVEIRRDVRDVLASKKTRRQTVWTERYRPEIRPFKNLEKAYDPLWDTVSWKSAIRAGVQAQKRHPDHMLSIRYEDLVADPELVIGEICDYLGLDYDPEMLAVSSRNAADWTGVTGRGIMSDSVGRWKTVLKPSELALSQALTSKELQTLGYATMPIAFSARISALVMTFRSIFEFFQRLYKRWRMGGISFLRIVLKGYLKRFSILRRE